MTKYELLRFLQPFADEVEIIVRKEGQPMTFRLDYDPTGSFDHDAAAIVIKVTP